MSINIWQDQGVVVAPLSADTPGQPNVIYEGGAVILSGTVFKMWFGTKNGVCYAESTNGTSWTRYGSNPVVSGAAKVFPKVFKNGSTYYMYNGPAGGPAAAYTSTDGVNWTQQNASAIALSQTWEGSGFIGQLSVAGIDSGGTWWGYYTAYDSPNYYMGRATSTDGIHWTKFANNPVITTYQPSNFEWHNINGTIYGWTEIVQSGIPNNGTLSIPSDISRYSGTNLGGPFIPLTVSTFYRTSAAEGVGAVAGQVADPTIVAANGNLYMYFTMTSNGNNPTNDQIGCAIASNTTFAQLVATQEGVFDVPFPSAAGLALNNAILETDTFVRGSLGANWTQISSSGSYQPAAIVSNQVEGTAAGDSSDSFYNGITWSADQWASVVVNVCLASSSVGVSLRQNTSGVLTQYRFIWTGATASPGTWSIISIVNAGAPSTLLSGTTTVNVADVLTGVVIGTTLSFYQNGNLLGVITDSSIATGAAGFAITPVTATTNAALGTWKAGNFQAAAAPASTITPILVQTAHANNASQATSISVPFTSNNTAGNCLFAMARVTGAALATAAPSDSAGNIGWATAFSTTNSHDTFYLFYCPNCKGGANTVILTETDGNVAHDFFQVVIAEYSNIAKVPLLQHAVGGPTSSTSVTTPTITTTIPNVLLIAGLENNVGNNLTLSALGTGFVQEDNAVGNVFFCDSAQNVAGTYQFTATLSSGNLWVSGIAAFQLMASSSGGQGNSTLGSVIFDLDNGGFPILELQTGTNA